MARIVLGLDFGTSNTSVSYADLDEPSIIKTAILEHADDGRAVYNTMPSAMFYAPELNKLFVGRDAIKTYINHEYDGRLLRNLKSVLDNVDATTKISGYKSISYFQFIYTFLKRVKERVIAEAGSDNIVGIVVGRPVHFFDDDDERDKKAEQNLRRIIERLGFSNIVFLQEPIAASFSLESKITTDETAFVADIGGGTSDFAAIALGPSHAQQTDRKKDIFATTGVKVGGTDFDKSFSLHEFMPELGFGSPVELENNGKMVFPRKYFDMLSNAFSINELYDYRVISEIEHLKQKALARPKIETLLHVIRTEHGHRLITEVETCKKGLSYQFEYPFDIKIAFNMKDDQFMTEKNLKDAVSVFKTETEQYLAGKNASRLLDEIKSKLENYKEQYVAGSQEYYILFGRDETYNIQQCKEQLDNIVYTYLEKWINKILSMSVSDVKKAFVEYKDSINRLNIDKIKKNINEFRSVKNIKINFETDYVAGYDVFDKLLGIQLPEKEIEDVLELVKEAVIRNISKNNSKNKQQETIDAKYKSVVGNFFTSIKKHIFVECKILDKNDVLLHNIQDLIRIIELSMFDSCLSNEQVLDELEEYAKISGAIHGVVYIPRDRLEYAIDEHMQKIQDSVNECIKKSGKNVSDFKYLIMTGGSSRIPKVRESIKKCFNNDIKIVCENLEDQADVSHDIIENIDTPDDISVGLCKYAVNVFK